MYALATDHLLYYKITPEPEGFRIRIWESPAAERHGAYLYILNRQVASMAEARDFLANHLSLNGGALACNQAEFPRKGKIHLMAFPTWNGDGDQ